MLLDTCTLIWIVSDQSKLSENVKNLIQGNEGNLYISSISGFEIGIKHVKEKLRLPISPTKWFNRALEFHGIEEIYVNSEIAIKSTELPLLHNDPCDRIIIASAVIYKMPILTCDNLIKQYKDVIVQW